MDLGFFRVKEVAKAAFFIYSIIIILSKNNKNLSLIKFPHSLKQYRRLLILFF